jgi:hypothetical protein
MIICGGTGSGKSYTALTIARMINSNFDVSKHVVFRVESFMELLNSGTIKRGDVIVWDEAGVGIPAREWYTISNKAINYVLQTFRHLNLCVIFTTPSFDYVDKQTRLLFHVYIETVVIDFKNQRVVVKVMENQFNPAMGKEYKKYMWSDGVKMERISIGKPSDIMIKKYEKIKKIFSNQLREDVQRDVEVAKATIKHRRITDADIMKDIKEKGIELNAYTLQFKFNVGKDRAYRIIKNYEKFSPTL